MGPPPDNSPNRTPPPAFLKRWKTLALLAKATYLLAASGLLSVALVLLLVKDGPMMEGPAQLLLYGMLALTFPTGLVAVYGWAYLAGAVHDAYPASDLASLLGAGGASGLTTIWFMLLVVGYLQWFVVLPALFRRLRNRIPANRRGA